MFVSCGCCILSRSSINILDRYLYRKADSNFFSLYFCSISLPFIYGAFLLALFGNVFLAVEYFLSFNCLLMALATNLAGLSFSYAFRYKDVRHIVLHAKIPELIFPFIMVMPFFSSMTGSYELSWRCLIPLIVTWCSFIPYFLNGNHKEILFDKGAFYICLSLLFQMVCSVFAATFLSSMEEILAYTTALLLWRCLLSLPLYIYTRKPVNLEGGFLSFGTLALILFRGVVALSTQFTFNWAIASGNPLIVWPLLNTTLIVSALASQFILKEKIGLCDWIALSGVFLGTYLSRI